MMDHNQGTDLETLWMRGLKPKEKETILNDIATILTQLRTLHPHKEGVVASAQGGAILDYRIGSQLVGPFQSHSSFHSFLRGGVPLENTAQIFGEDIASCHSNNYRTFFSHSDLAPRNIIIRNGRIVGVVDWALAGWYPEYWDLTKAYYTSFKVPDWPESIKLKLPSYADELMAERLLWRLYDEPGNVSRNYGFTLFLILKNQSLSEFRSCPVSSSNRTPSETSYAMLSRPLDFLGANKTPQWYAPWAKWQMSFSMDQDSERGMIIASSAGNWKTQNHGEKVKLAADGERDSCKQNEISDKSDPIWQSTRLQPWRERTRDEGNYTNVDICGDDRCASHSLGRFHENVTQQKQRAVVQGSNMNVSHRYLNMENAGALLLDSQLGWIKKVP
ncbi:predicted protein [Histoplasma mississippiense (nom. inval.)]|uniref:predicted protein n=1 Tax=Ajellomyces capsulatus (strain NAm1 / WU24) TaxID=2059318 RepID=UPI000157C895|nr:predicted protein [Histoplasma mississippiense (nom. inval.)]EDN09621.1 predicted protein [Histoplasma mississippiense (nom. inval.)]